MLFLNFKEHFFLFHRLSASPFSWQDAEGFNAVHHVHSMVLEMQAKHEKLVQTTAELVNEYNRREKSLEELYDSVDRLDQNKADKQHVTQEIGIKVS